LKRLSELLSRPGRILASGAPDGVDALALAEAARSGNARQLIHVARDDTRMAFLLEALRWFAPEIEVLDFPAWDCLPYDRSSPHGDIVGRRLAALGALAENPSAPRILLTTCNAILQRVPPRAAIAGGTWTVTPGSDLDTDSLFEFLGRNGYVRTGTVMEAGEYAVRGGIIDLFPSGGAEPVRLDMFGDTVESIRTFDPLSQRSIGSADRLTLGPVAEFRLDPESIERFRVGYRELFGAANDGDPLYEAVTNGRRMSGVEHWLPLFHPRMETLFDYLPDAPVFMDPAIEQAREDRLTAIEDYYQARREVKASPGLEEMTYKPLPPRRLYLDEGEWQAALDSRASVAFSPFQAPETTPHSVDLGGRKSREFAAERAREDVNLFDAVVEEVRRKQGQGSRVYIAGYTAGSRDRLATLLREHGMEAVKPVDGWAEAQGLDAKAVGLIILGLEGGFEVDGLVVISEQDILGDRLARPPRRRRRRAVNFIAEASGLEAGDLVVHLDHGIGRFDGLETLEVSDAPHDCLRLIYHGGDRLYVPVENVEVLSRYGGEESSVQLDKLGGVAWQARKAKVKKRIRDMAAELVAVAAQRRLRQSESFVPPEGLYEEFSARFPYTETDDQLQAIEECLDDLASGPPMDRLVCGDVGFGKTEVALRAALSVVAHGKQVAIVVPTTLLARQHYKTFKERFSGFPFKVAQLSRLTPSKEATTIRHGLKSGEVDIVIGTHALLGKTIAFDRLGLLIIDEEQHFGVAQKERLKQLKNDVHVLTLTATPIPRTLQMALSGVRELSLIATPPVDRLAVRTFVLPFDPVVIREAIMRERHRGGQTFYVCPRIEDLEAVYRRLGELVPEVKVLLAHGRMSPTQIEEAMTAFYDGQYDVLLSTTIVESGLDIPNANTLIIHRADMFGLAQLYQLRGRIGRSKRRAYAYFTVPTNRMLTQAAEKRLHVIQTMDELGAGFGLASQDLEIRGGGNLLGEEQSGQVKEVGLELYQEMIEEAVRAARDGPQATAEDRWSPQITIGTAVLIPEDYVADLSLRLSLYRRIAALEDSGEIDGFAAELIDRFGPLPNEVEHLLKIVAIKQFCRQAGIEKIDAGPRGAVVGFRQDRFAAPEKLIAYISRNPTTLKPRPDQKLVVTGNWGDPENRLAGVLQIAKDLAEMAG